MNVNEKMISVVEQTNRGERQYDLASRLLEDRIIFLSGEVNTDLANYIIAQLIYLEARDPHKDIALYINRDRKSTRLNSSHWNKSRMPSSA